MPEIKHGPEGIRQVGHRTYVGGLWDEIGMLQFNFVKNHGLNPDHIFLDIACGSLRARVHLVPYFNSGNYLEFDKEKTLINLGLEKDFDKI